MSISKKGFTSYPGTEHLDFFFDIATAKMTYVFQGFHCSRAGSWDLNTTPKMLYSGGYANPTCDSITSSPYTNYGMSYNPATKMLTFTTVLKYTTGSDSRPYGFTNGMIYSE